MQELFQYATKLQNYKIIPNSLEQTEFLALPLAISTIIQIFSLKWAEIYFLNFKVPKLVTMFLAKP